MSLATWMKEFYPKEASEVKGRAAAMRHSLRKWIGLLPSHMRKHGITKDNRTVWCGELAFDIDDYSCALCCLFYGFHGCDECPLTEILGERCDSGSESPYSVWISTGNPKPMIAALRKAMKKYGVKELKRGKKAKA